MRAMYELTLGDLPSLRRHRGIVAGCELEKLRDLDHVAADEADRGAGAVVEGGLRPHEESVGPLVGADSHGAGRHSVDRALDILAAGLMPDAAVVTHEFGLDDYREAIETAIDRGSSRAIKVVFRPNR